MSLLSTVPVSTEWIVTTISNLSPAPVQYNLVKYQLQF